MCNRPTTELNVSAHATRLLFKMAWSLGDIMINIHVVALSSCFGDAKCRTKPWARGSAIGIGPSHKRSRSPRGYHCTAPTPSRLCASPSFSGGGSIRCLLRLPRLPREIRRRLMEIFQGWCLTRSFLVVIMTGTTILSLVCRRQPDA